MNTPSKRGAVTALLFGLLALPLCLHLHAQDGPAGAATTKLEALLSTRGALLTSRVKTLGEVGKEQPVMIVAMAVTRPNETASTRGVRFVASVGPDAEREAYLDYEEIERFARAIDSMITTLGQWAVVAPDESREMQYTTKGGVGLHLFVDRTVTGISDRSYLLFADPTQPTVVVAPLLEQIDLEHFRDALHAGYDWLTRQ